MILNSYLYYIAWTVSGVAVWSRLPKWISPSTQAGTRSPSTNDSKWKWMRRRSWKIIRILHQRSIAPNRQPKGFPATDSQKWKRTLRRRSFRSIAKWMWFWASLRRKEISYWGYRAKWKINKTPIFSYDHPTHLYSLSTAHHPPRTAPLLLDLC